MGKSRYAGEFEAEAIGQIVDRGYSVKEVWISPCSINIDS